MNTPITTDIIARLRELIAAATALDRIVGGRVLHAIFLQSADDAKAIVTAKAKAQDAVAGALIALPSILEQLAAQAAEIGRLRAELSESEKRVTAIVVIGAILGSEWFCEQADGAERPSWSDAIDIVRKLKGERNSAQARVADLERELALSAQRNAALLSDKDAVGAVLRTDSSLAELRGRAERLEGLLRKHSALACSTCMGTGAYLGDEDRDGPCDACGGTGAVLPEEVADVLAEREGGR